MCNCKASKTKYIYVVLLPFKYIEVWETLCLLPYNLKSWAHGANILDYVHQQTRGFYMLWLSEVLEGFLCLIEKKK